MISIIAIAFNVLYLGETLLQLFRRAYTHVCTHAYTHMSMHRSGRDLLVKNDLWATTVLDIIVSSLTLANMVIVLIMDVTTPKVLLTLTKNLDKCNKQNANFQRSPQPLTVQSSSKEVKFKLTAVTLENSVSPASC